MVQVGLKNNVSAEFWQSNQSSDAECVLAKKALLSPVDILQQGVHSIAKSPKAMRLPSCRRYCQNPKAGGVCGAQVKSLDRHFNKTCHAPTASAVAKKGAIPW